MIIELILHSLLSIMMVVWFAILSKKIIDINEAQIKFYFDNNCSDAFLNYLF